MGFLGGDGSGDDGTQEETLNGGHSLGLTVEALLVPASSPSAKWVFGLMGFLRILMVTAVVRKWSREQ